MANAQRIVLVTLVLIHWQRSEAQVPERNWWVPNLAAYGMAANTDELFMVGQFTQIGPPDQYHVALDPLTGEVVAGPRTDQEVLAYVADGEGGWFGCGYFTRFGTEARNGLVRVNGDGSIHPWYPAVDGVVRDIVFADDVVYIAGDFMMVNGVDRPYCAALDPTSGALLEWDPQPNGVVNAIDVVGGTVFLGGGFNSVGGVPRNNLCAVSATDGSVLPWNPPASGYVSHLRANAFGVVAAPNGVLQCFDLNGALLATPSGCTGVSDIELLQDTVYACGQLLLGGNLTQSVYAFPMAGDLFLSVQANQLVSGICIHEESLYVAGSFLEIGGAARYRSAKLDRITGAVQNWIPLISAEAFEVAFIGGNVLLSGWFVSASGVLRNQIAALDISTGLPNDRPLPAVYGSEQLALYADVLYFAGSFEDVNGQSGYGLGAYDLANGQLLDWSPALPNGYISHLAVVGDTLFITGSFSSFNGQPRNCLAAVNAQTRELLGWSPSVTHPDGAAVVDISVDGGMVYFRGYFDNVGGQPREGVAAVDRATGAVSPWYPDLGPEPWIVDVVARDGVVLLAHFEQEINGLLATGVTAVDGTDGTNTIWQTTTEFNPDVMVVTDTAVVIAGVYMATVLNASRAGIAQLNPADGSLLAWNLAPEFCYSLNSAGPVMIQAGQRLFMSSSVSQDSILLSPYFGVLVNDLATATAPVLSQAAQPFAYPNPSNGSLRLEGLPPTASSFHVLDMAGRIALKGQLSSTLDLHALPPGSYSLMVLDRAGHALESAPVVIAP